MSEILFKKIDYNLSKLIQDIEFGDIGLPDIQRPFLWKATRVRDLFDSMYRGFPVGYLLFWANDHFEGTKKIGIGEKEHKVPNLLIVDGQQRLTSLYTVLKGRPIINSNFQEELIRIAFRPRDGLFEVADAAIRKDPEFIPNISAIWAEGAHTYKFVKAYLNNLKNHREIDGDLENAIGDSLERLHNLQNYPFTALEISSSVDEEQVADIFVRINSEGVRLNQADFLLTLLSVFWDEGRRDLEIFCRGTRQAPQPGDPPSPYNHHIQTDPDQLLRMGVAVGFKRGRLKSVYQVLRGKDLETGQFSGERRESQFDVLKEAQARVLNLNNWHEFLKSLVTAGFRSSKMISSETAIIYAYVFYLLGREKFGLDPIRLRWLISRWFFMSSITGRYSASPETTMDGDLARLRGLSSADQFVETLEKIIQDSFTTDFWDITLPNALETSSARSPALLGYYSALNNLDAPILFSNAKVSSMFDPALKPTKQAIERHHLFPKGYLERIGVTGVRRINQAANYALVEWSTNIAIRDRAPTDYWSEQLKDKNIKDEDLLEMSRFHALPEGWYDMDYDEFLSNRRKLMAAIIREGFEKLSATN